MTYTTYSEPTSWASLRNTVARIGTGIGGFLATVGRVLVVNSTGQRRLNTVHLLQSKSDAELAAMNLRREDIVRHVFRDAIYG